MVKAFEKTKLGGLILLMTLLGWLSSSPAKGDIYKWVDERGVVHFSNAPTDPRFRLFLRETGLTGKQFIKAYDSIIRQQANIYGLDHRLVKAVIKAESDFNPNAVSHKGAQGLMQLMPKTASKMKVKDSFDPNENIAGGVRFLKHLLVRFNHNLTLALAAYNAGPEAVEKYRGVPPYPETQRYVQKVMKYYKTYRD